MLTKYNLIYMKYKHWCHKTKRNKITRTSIELFFFFKRWTKSLLYKIYSFFFFFSFHWHAFNEITNIRTKMGVVLSKFSFHPNFSSSTFQINFLPTNFNRKLWTLNIILAINDGLDLQFEACSLNYLKLLAHESGVINTGSVFSSCQTFRPKFYAKMNHIEYKMREKNSINKSRLIAFHLLITFIYAIAVL